MVMDKHIVLVLASATTGKTIQQSLDGIRYYGGIVEGVSALFSAVKKVGDVEVDTIFTNDDVGDYQTYVPGDCPFCSSQRKLDAIVNSFGYSKI
jgi:orotate phosphoribosyltransferase